jgi:hypothetical protein
MRKTTDSQVCIVAALLFAVATMFFLCGCESDGGGDIPVSDANGYALAIGLNKVDPAHYGGFWDGELTGCEPDAKDMNEIATSQGFKVEMLLTPNATRDKVLKKLSALAEELKPGDLLVVSYSGHGGQIPDKNDDEVEDGLDETWCLYDGQLLDDELYGAWMKFQAGVRILVFSDSCHSGTMLKMKRRDIESPTPERARELDEMWQLQRVPPKLDRARMLMLPELREAVRVRPYLRDRIGRLPTAVPQPNEPAPSQPVEPEAERVFLSRAIPPGVSMKTYEQNQIFYDELGEAAPKEDPSSVKASVILISGCEDTQGSADIGFNGLFTWMLKKVWDNGAFTGDHRKLHEDIMKRVKKENPDQVPYFFTVGTGLDAFIEQRPYTLK